MKRQFNYRISPLLVEKDVLKHNHPLWKTELAKFETNAEKNKVFAEHFTSCFTFIEEDDENNEIHIEYADKTPNENINEPNGRITPTSPKEIQQIIIKLVNKKSPGHDHITKKN